MVLGAFACQPHYFSPSQGGALIGSLPLVRLYELFLRSVHSNHWTQMARCGKLRWMALFLALAGCLAAQPKTLIGQAFDRLYNFVFKAAQEMRERGPED